MPIPKPADGEREEDFINRCMSDDIMVEEYPETDQRLGVCYQSWGDRNKGDNMDVERKSVQIELKEDTPGAFIARIAQFNVMDLDSDVTLPGAFPDGKQVLVSAYQHGSWMGELPVGKAIMKEDGEFAIGDGQFNLGSDSGKEHYETVKFSGQLQEWSYGFKVLEQADEKELEEWAEKHDGARPYRIIKKLDPFEISPVMRGAGVGTATIAIKSDSTYADQAEAVLVAVDALVVRTKSLADLRRKEGRELSETNRDRMETLHASLAEAADNLKELLVDTEPVDKASAEKAYVEFTRLNFEFAEANLR
jgi:hypothetical protein